MRGVDQVRPRIHVERHGHVLVAGVCDIKGNAAGLEACAAAEDWHRAHRATQLANGIAGSGGCYVFVLDAVQRQIGDERPGVRHAHQRHMVELAVHQAAQAAVAAGGGEGDVAAVMADDLHIAMRMAGEHRVVALAEHRFDLPPIVLRSVGVVPARLVDDHDGPAGVGKALQGLRDEGHLFGLRPRARHRRAHVARHAEELRVQHQKQHVLVHEAVVGRAKARLPRFRHHGVAHVVVAGGVEKRHIEPGHEALELVPLAV